MFSVLGSLYYRVLSFVHLDQRPIGRCGLPWAKTAAASKWPLRATWALLFGARGQGDIVIDDTHIKVNSLPT